jgi:hypothetical protein
VASAIRVRGLADLNRALARADRDVRLGVRRELREVAEPVRADAERLAVSGIRNVHEGDPWSRMRVGVTRSLVYVAPRQRGAARGPRRRRNMADLLAVRAMEPALDINRPLVERNLEEMLDDVADKFNQGGTIL